VVVAKFNLCCVVSVVCIEECVVINDKKNVFLNRNLHSRTLFSVNGIERGFN
jgi:hypothetical protein